MPVPDAALPTVFTDPLNPSNDACDAFKRLLAIREQLGVLFSWMFTDDGHLTPEFNAELYKWIYGSLTASGTGGDYILTFNEPYNQVATQNRLGRVVFFIANHASPASTTGSKIILDGLPAVNLVNAYGVALEADDIRNGQLVEAIYDGTAYRILSGLSRISIDQLEGDTEGQFLRSRLVGGKQVAKWESVYRTTDAALQSVPVAGTPATFIHGFGQMPILWQVSFVCQAADLGYAIGDEVLATSVIAHGATDDDYTPAISCDTNEIRFCQSSGEGRPRFANKGGGAVVLTGITLLSWKLRAMAIK